MSDDLHQDDIKRQRWEEGYVRTRRNVGRRRRRIRNLVDASKEGRFFELGCGDGLNLTVARELGFRDLVGMDYSLDLVRLSEVRPVLVGDGHNLPLSTGSMNTIFVDSVLHHLTDYEAAAEECHRVLASGGRLYYFEPRPGPLRSLLDWVTMSGVLAFIPFFSSRRETLAEEWSLYQDWLARHAEMRRNLSAAGLEKRYARKGPIGMFLCFEKPTDATATAS